MSNLSLYTFFDARRRWATLAVVLGVIFLARLGIWQLDRLEWRRGVNAATLAELNSPPISLNDDLSSYALTEMINRQISVSGSYDFSNQLLVESQSYNEVEPGRYLLTPLILENDPGTAVLVNRGFIPVGEEDFEQFSAPADQLLLEGRLQRSQVLSGGRTTEISPDRRIFRIDVAAIDAVTPYELLPVYVLPTPDQDALRTGALPRPVEPDLSLDEGNHLSYAYQWFSFAILLVIIYIVLVYRQQNTPVEEE
ncbi:MAG: SURF1 family protein [Chloroflexota bacterium]